MELKPISDLIDQRTRIARTMIFIDQYTAKFSGYLAIVVDGKLVQRRIYSMPYNAQFDSCMYIIYKQVNYAVNLPCKPISGAFNVQSLSSY